MTDSPTPRTPRSIHNELDRNETQHHSITVRIRTTNGNAYYNAKQALLTLFTDLLITDSQTDIDFESASTTQTHFDTHPF